MNDYIITSVLNHNTVRCRHQDSQTELLAYGVGIGFHHKSGEHIDSESFTKLYEIKDVKLSQQYEDLLRSVDLAVLDVSEEIIEEACHEFHMEADNHLHIALLDHINFSVRRYRENIVITNIFLEETECMYPKEFQFSKKMLDLVNERLKIDLPIAEAGFICMHIHAAMHGEKASYSAMMVQIVTDCMKIIEERYHIHLSRQNFLYQRMVIHLKFAVKRSSENVQLDNFLETIIPKKCRGAYETASAIADHLADTYNIQINESEKCYLAIHIQNIVSQKV